jgi:kynurenine 3-monooxygenase
VEAVYLAKRGAEVHLYEYREDIRTMEHVSGKSINLAMSVRGLGALRKIGLDEHVMKEYGIPMYGRMIHTHQGLTSSIPYGKEDQAIFSVGRRYINEALLNEGDKYDGITFHFNHKLMKADLDTPQLTFERRGELEPGQERIVVVRPDIAIGCDGAYSAVRREMMKRPRFDYSQEYIPHAYMELSVPATVGGDFAMEPNYLHIWPRGKFMMIGLPNQDKSFTITLFMPINVFESITDTDSLIQFFNEHFRDSIALIGRDKLVKDFFNNNAQPLVSVKCFPYNVSSTSLIMGDAAHAMVPFYGQGMNCGMEDCLMLEDALDREPGDLEAALNYYSAHRNPDVEAMCDLAMYNYVEMRDLVNKKSFLVRKKLDSFLHWVAPTWWVPLYTSVTFSTMRYHQCVSNRKWQDSALTLASSLVGLSSLAGVFFLARHEATISAMSGLSRAVLRQLPGEIQRAVKFS